MSPAEEAVRTLLIAVGEDPDREGLVETPARVVKALKELTAGYRQIPADILSKTFNEGSDEMVVLNGIRFHSMCEHHMLPFAGVAHVGYIPRSRVVGLSKMARLVQAYAQRLQVQERMTRQIATAMMEHLGALGAACVVRSSHLCMGSRGVQKPDAEMVTSCMLGTFREDQKARAEFFQLANR